MNVPRITVGLARERYPQYAYAQISQGQIAHFITTRLEVPSGFVFTLCGDAGFAKSDASEEDMACLRCTRAASRPVPCDQRDVGHQAGWA
jgi:hypothetical protein